ncbi:hypothetical protein, partial [Asaia sp. SF2.1]|uniref:hypothetical protein n=1 Tax=Asaia sp. SF2.1 TaxID=406101 RepID=UPI001F259DFE
MGAPKDGPTEDMLDRDLNLSDLYSKASNFLDRPPDKLLRAGIGLFLSAAALTWERAAAIMA